MFIIFGISLVISHYALSYIFMFSLIIVYILIFLSDRYDIQRYIDYVLRYKHNNYLSSFKENKDYKIISTTFVIFFLIFTIAWYMYVSDSAPLTAFLNMGNQIASSISTDFLNPNTVQGLFTLQTQLPLLHKLGKYVHLLTQVFIVIGFFAIILKLCGMKFNREYLAFILVNFVILTAAVTIPFFSSSLNTERLYQINLMFLAPLCIIGGITVLKIAFKYLHLIKGFDFYDTSIKLISIFLVVYFLFNVGLIYYAFNDDSTSISLNTTIDSPSYNHEEIMGVKW